MYPFINSPLVVGALQLRHRLIQGPLAGYSCAPFRQLFSLFTAPAYCVSEMISAHDIVHKHSLEGRYLYRSPKEGILCYQISGNDPGMMAASAEKLSALGAELIDINCGCPKNKIRKNGAGSALLERPDQLIAIVKQVRKAAACPLTVKIRLIDNQNALIDLAKQIADAGADALIVHGRRWVDDYDTSCDLQQIAAIKRVLSIPVIANGDIAENSSLKNALVDTGCDAFMLGRASTGKPWLFQELLTGQLMEVPIGEVVSLFIQHLQGLADLEGEYKAMLQSKSLVRYYFRKYCDPLFLKEFSTLIEVETFINANCQ